MNIVNAIKSLEPDSEFIIENGDYSTIRWIKNTPETAPTEAEVNTEFARLQVEEDAQEYARNRKLEYDVLNQFELMTDDTANSTTAHADAIAVIKTKWPKDNSGPVE